MKEGSNILNIADFQRSKSNIITSSEVRQEIPEYDLIRGVYDELEYMKDLADDINTQQIKLSPIMIEEITDRLGQLSQRFKDFLPNN
jgi:hypothetical protein